MDRAVLLVVANQVDEEDEESHDPFEWEFKENKEMWDIFFPKCSFVTRTY
jgi:hypothetical protein